MFPSCPFIVPWFPKSCELQFTLPRCFEEFSSFRGESLQWRPTTDQGPTGQSLGEKTSWGHLNITRATWTAIFPSLPITKRRAGQAKLILHEAMTSLFLHLCQLLRGHTKLHRAQWTAIPPSVTMATRGLLETFPTSLKIQSLIIYFQYLSTISWWSLLTFSWWSLTNNFMHKEFWSEAASCSFHLSSPPHSSSM